MNGRHRCRAALRSLAVLVVILSPAVARELPRPGTFAVKQVPEQRIMYVIHHGPEHIASSFARLVAYYLKDSLPCRVIFPQMTMQLPDSTTMVAVAYTGHARPDSGIKLGTLPGGPTVSLVVKGSYERLPAAIAQAYQRIAAAGHYAPQPGAAPLLLYWNSPDDHLPRDLITEIRIPVIERPRDSGK